MRADAKRVFILIDRPARGREETSAAGQSVFSFLIKVYTLERVRMCSPRTGILTGSASRPRRRVGGLPGHCVGEVVLPGHYVPMTLRFDLPVINATLEFVSDLHAVEPGADHSRRTSSPVCPPNGSDRSAD